MNFNLRHIIPIIVLFLAMSYTSYGQEPCQPGYVRCRGGENCIPARQCGVGPPPPGLVVPIDDHLPFLLAAGLGLGILFFGYRGRKASASN